MGIVSVVLYFVLSFFVLSFFLSFFLLFSVFSLFISCFCFLEGQFDFDPVDIIRAPKTAAASWTPKGVGHGFLSSWGQLFRKKNGGSSTNQVGLRQVVSIGAEPEVETE